MTEAEWHSTDDWRAMLRFIRDKTSPRKIRLFGVACCRGIAHLFHVETCGEAVDVAERYADGLATEEQRCGWYEKVVGLKEGEYELGSAPELWHDMTAAYSGFAVSLTVSENIRFVTDAGEEIVRLIPSCGDLLPSPFRKCFAERHLR